MGEQHPLIRNAFKVDYQVDGKDAYVGTPPTVCYAYPYYDSVRKTLEVNAYDFAANARKEFYVPLRDVVKAGALSDFHEACELFGVPAGDVEDILASATAVTAS